MYLSKKKSIVFKAFFKSIAFFCTLISKSLPLWKEAKVVKTLSPILYPVTPPVNTASLPRAFADKFVIAKIIPRRRIFMLHNVYVSGEPVVFKSLRVFIPSLPWLRDLHHYRNGRFLLKQWMIKQVTVINTGIVALAYDEWSASNYYHWIIESLPRLLLIKEKYPDCLLLIPEPAPEFIHITTKLMGFENVYPLRRDKVLKISNLVVPELVYYYEHDEKANLAKSDKQAIAGFKRKDSLKQPTEYNYYDKELIILVKQQILKSYGVSKPPFRKIYISRSKQKTRRLLNESEILPLLNKYGFEQVFFEEMSFEAQINLMQETAVLAGVHGANMVNILFMQPRTAVIEMMNKDYLNDAYYLLASSANLCYFSVPCTMADQTIKLSGDSVLLNDAHVLVDVQELESAIIMALH